MPEFVIHPDSPWLAPLAGYSDLPFRMLCRKFGCGVACSEMVSVKGVSYGNAGTDRLLDTCPEDNPMVLQLFGADPEFFTPVMERLVAQGFRNFDLNAGCPVRKVLKSGSGVGLMQDPDTLVRIAEIMIRTAASHPEGGRVGVKFRLGFEKGEDTYLDLARRLEDAGAAWLTLHPRYGKQMFAGQADWSKLARLKEEVSVPVIGSGDLFTPADGVRCLEQTGIDGIMFARGALFDPAIFDRFRALRRGEVPQPLDGTGLAAVVREHILHTRHFDDTVRGFRKIRSIIPRYAKGLEGIRSLRAGLNQCETWEELEQVAASIARLNTADRSPNQLVD